ncbi:MAG: FtsL-like putative cell division protein [Janthinobacterium lividum]
MATNTLRPNAGPPRGNVARPAAPPPPAPVPEEVPVAAPVPQPVPTPPPVPEARQPKPEPAAPRRKAAPEKPASTWSLFSLLDRFTGLDSFFQEGLPVQYLPHVLFVMLLTLIYIGNTHYGNRMNRNIQRLKLETEDLRADYTTLSSDYMEASKQSEVARKVAAIGLVESSSPPFRIVVPAGRLDGAELEAMPVLTADTLAARAARDSAASQRADSLLGRARRQAATPEGPDDALEAGPPPPGPEEDDTEGVELAKSAAPVVPREKKASKKSLKKSKSVQSERAGNTRQAKPVGSTGSTNNSKKTATHERKR